MGKKAGFLTPKAIGNRIKAKGLQKLRWYCEMCQKQCRDENGFKCHQTSEGHLRQMRIFSENPHAVMERYSHEFEQLFLETLSRNHNTKRTHANLVYKEYIADKHHVHMNSTKFTTLTMFVQHLGKKGAVVADETEKGWFISWINRDPDMIARQEAANKKQKSDLDDEARRQKEVKRRVKIASSQNEEFGVSTQASELIRKDENDKVSLKMSSSSLASSLSNDSFGSNQKKLKPSNSFDILTIPSSASLSSSSSSSTIAPPPPPPKMSAMESMMQRDLMNKRKKQEEVDRQAELRYQNKKKKEEESFDEEAEEEVEAPIISDKRLENWITPGLIVKIMNKEVGQGKYYKLKGEIITIIEKFIAVVRVTINSNDQDGNITTKTVRVQIDQDDLETVIPKIDGQVKIVNGKGRGSIGYIKTMDTEHFCVSVFIQQNNNKYNRQTLDNIQYEDVCKLA